MDAIASAHLASVIPPERAIATTIDREQMVAALEEGSTPELVLDVARRDAHGTDERATVGVAWSRDDLERVLVETAEREVVLTFDRAELDGLLADVEAHGLRERAAVLTIAAAGAFAAGAGAAAAMPIGEAGPVGGAGASTGIVSDAASGGGYAAPAAATASDAMVTDASSGAGYAAPAAAADGTISDAASGGGYAAPAAAAAGSDAMVTDASSGAGYVAPTAAAAAGSFTDVSSGGGYPEATPAPAGDGGFTFDAPAPIAGGLAAALALTIAGAAFTSRRRSTPPKPA